MSETGNTQAAQIVAALESAQVIWYVQTVAAGLFTYEFCLTFGREVELFWRRKFTIASVLVILNRYVPLVVNLMDTPYVIPHSGITYSGTVLNYLQFLPWAVFSALRAYTLASKAWPIALVVFILSIAPLVANYVILGYSVATFNSDDSLKDLPRSIRCRRSDILFRDGILYFLVLLIINIIHLGLSILSMTTSLSSGGQEFVFSFILLSSPISAILITRFMMDLQEVNNNMAHQNSLASMGSLRFERFIGSLGTTLPAPDLASGFENVPHPDAACDISEHTDSPTVPQGA
ncbi:hypothetical protein C8Q76DRAFT_793688 [Earliella scabrosa]|nr:hypothetical protein C8Q76DRAFT_793688 [Earliella scabrosa]